VGDAELLGGYAEQLAKLDPTAVWRELHELSAPAEPVLMCWAVPPR
jgi:hypothetical protein